MEIKAKLLELRKKIKKKKPKFKRQEWFRKKPLGEKWRKPRGINSKLRIRKKSKGKVPSPGYGSPRLVKGLNSEGYREILVRNVRDLEKINPKEEIAVIASGVGKKKRFEIIEKALKKNIKIGNDRYGLTK
ncbi:MAG: 50S ribosomal protein L32e [Candidatus Aenigmarchaeota archaeon]|nr:50S ribosomal protein L32e [Candidatus Aenigmarchaeota archaeon]